MKKVLVLVSLLLLPLYGFAQNIVLSNGTAYVYALSINGVCADKPLNEFEVKFIESSKVLKLCGTLLECQIVLHKNSCTGPYEGRLTIHNESNASLDASPDRCVSTAISVGQHVTSLFLTESQKSECLSKKR